MKKSLRMIAAIAVFLMLPFFAITARAEPDDELPVYDEETGEVVEIITGELPVLPETLTPDDFPTDGQENPVTDFPIEPPRPFTPSGTGTVVDNATDGDGKEFYTISTADGSVFYLVIDRQRTTENVYFLNAVTVADLMALAEIPEVAEPVLPDVLPPVTQSEPETEQPIAPAENRGNNMGIIFIVGAAVLICGVAGWYFKVHKPKQQKMVMEEDYSGESDHYGTADADAYGDSVPWYDESDVKAYPDEDEGEEE